MICCAQVLSSALLFRESGERGRAFSLSEDVQRATLGEDTGTAEETFLWIKGGRIRAPSTDRPPTCSHNPEKSSQLVCIQPAGQRMLGSDVRIYLKTPSISSFYRKVQSPGWLTGISLHNAYKIFQGLFFQPDNPAETRNFCWPHKAYCFSLANPCTASRPRPLTELWRKQK